MPTRRAMLFAAVTFAAGLSAGGAIGSLLGAAARAAPRPDEIADLEQRLMASGNPELGLLRHLAVAAPIKALERWLPMFVEQLRSAYPRDPWLWHGMRRLADRLLAANNFPNSEPSDDQP